MLPVFHRRLNAAADSAGPRSDSSNSKTGRNRSNIRSSLRVILPPPNSIPFVDDGSVNIGIAAHITAASEGGPRYDPALTAEQRSGFDNGIWCCRNCAGLVDSDSSGYSVETLRAWKQEAEARAAQAIAAALATGSRVVELESVLSGHTKYVWDVAVTPDGRLAVSASNDCTLRVWDRASGLLRSVITGHETSVCSVAINHSGSLVAGKAVNTEKEDWDF
jgi:WD40 repeat protein